MKKIFLCAAAVFGYLMLNSCGTVDPSSGPLYSWYDSENAAYEFTKAPTDQLRDDLMKEYAKMQSGQRGVRGTVPPGFYADYGYILIKAGREEEGLALLQKELEVYPESKVFVGRILKQLGK